MGDYTWRAFVGSMNADGTADWFRLDARECTWEQARDLLAERIGRYADDECDDCRNQARAELARLVTTALGSPFAGDVEGEDYLLQPDPQPQVVWIPAAN